MAKGARKDATEHTITTAYLIALHSSAPDSLLNHTENQFLAAAKKGDVESVSKFIENQIKFGATLEATDETGSRFQNLGEAALNFAARNNNYGVVQLLIRKGFSIKKPHPRSCQCKDCDSLGLLLKSMARLNTYRALASPVYLSLAYLVATEGPSISEVGSDESLTVKEQKEPEQKEPEPPSKYERESISVPFTGKRTLLRLSQADIYQSLPSDTKFTSKGRIDWRIPKFKAPEKPLIHTLDPIYSAFELNGKLEQLAESEFEFKIEYKQLSNQCEEYAVDLLNMCRNMKEIACVMRMPWIPDSSNVSVKGATGDAKNLSILNFAIKNKNERFVVHPYSQLMLNSVLYRGLYGWQYKSFLMQSLLVFLYTLLIPFLSIFYLLAPQNRVSRMLATPLAKFVSHTGSFCWFIFILIFSAMEDIFGISIMEVSIINILVIVWVMGLILEEAKEAFRQGRKRYLSQWWNIITIIMLALFLIAGVLWVLGYAVLGSGEPSIKSYFKDITRESAFKLTLLSNSFYAMAFLLSFLHITDALQLNSTMGPLQLSLMKMCKDVTKFMLLIVILFLAFAWAIRKVYSQYVFMSRVFLMGGTGQAEHSFASISKGIQSLFWAMFDQADLEMFRVGSTEFMITQKTGEFLFALFNIIAVLIILNMMIAMMADSFQKVASDADIQWKFSRTQMWMQYVDKGSAVPPPFNLIPTWKNVVFAVKWMLRKVRKEKYEEIQTLEEESEDMDNNGRRKIIDNLIERYFTEREARKEHSAPRPVQNLT